MKVKNWLWAWSVIISLTLIPCVMLSCAKVSNKANKASIFKSKMLYELENKLLNSSTILNSFEYELFSDVGFTEHKPFFSYVALHKDLLELSQKGCLPHKEQFLNEHKIFCDNIREIRVISDDAVDFTKKVNQLYNQFLYNYIKNNLEFFLTLVDKELSSMGEELALSPALTVAFMMKHHGMSIPEFENQGITKGDLFSNGDYFYIPELLILTTKSKSSKIVIVSNLTGSYTAINTYLYDVSTHYVDTHNQNLNSSPFISDHEAFNASNGKAYFKWVKKISTLALSYQGDIKNYFLDLEKKCWKPIKKSSNL